MKSMYEALCAIWYRFYNLKNVKNTHRGVLILEKLQAEAHESLWKIRINSWKSRDVVLEDLFPLHFNYILS